MLSRKCLSLNILKSVSRFQAERASAIYAAINVQESAKFCNSFRESTISLGLNNIQAFNRYFNVFCRIVYSG